MTDRGLRNDFNHFLMEHSPSHVSSPETKSASNALRMAQDLRDDLIYRKNADRAGAYTMLG